MVRKLLVLLGWLLVAFSMYIFYGELRAVTEKPRISTVLQQVSVDTQPAQPTPTITSTEVVQEYQPTQTTTPIPSPTPEPSLIDGYVLADVIDMGSKESTALSIRLPEGGELASTWAKAYALEYGDEGVFDPHNGTIYSIAGDMVTVYVHSGRVYYKPILFGSNLDLYLRRSDNGNLSLSKGQQKLSELIGTTAYWCQAENIKEFTVFDPRYGCPGVMLEVKVSAGAIVTQDAVESLGKDPLRNWHWMNTNYPGFGFEFLDARNSFLLITCVEKYPDQPSVSGVEPYVYNRLVLAFTIVNE